MQITYEATRSSSFWKLHRYTNSLLHQRRIDIFTSQRLRFSLLLSRRGRDWNVTLGLRRCRIVKPQYRILWQARQNEKYNTSILSVNFLDTKMTTATTDIQDRHVHWGQAHTKCGLVKNIK